MIHRFLLSSNKKSLSSFKSVNCVTRKLLSSRKSFPFISSSIFEDLSGNIKFFIPCLTFLFIPWITFAFHRPLHPQLVLYRTAKTAKIDKTTDQTANPKKEPKTPKIPKTPKAPKKSKEAKEVKEPKSPKEPKMKRFLVSKDPKPETTPAAPTAEPTPSKEAAPSEGTKQEPTPSTKSEPMNIVTNSDFNVNSHLFRSLDTLPNEIKKMVSWKAGESIPYSVLVNTFEDISKVSGRLDKENYFARLFSAIMVTCPSELESIIYLSSNHVFPAYAGLELGIGDSLLVKAICEATGRKKDAVEEAYEKEGDLGIVAVQSRTSQKTLGFVAKPKPLMASYVLEQFREITKIKGEKAQARKVDIIKSMMVRCQGQEAKYIVRALQGKLRIGTAEQTVLVALAHALVDVQKLDADELNLSVEELAILDKKDDDYERHKVKPTNASSSSEQKTAETLAEVISSKSLDELYHSVHVKETFEARHLRRHFQGKTHLGRDKLNEYAEIAIKRAFSECPNLDSLCAAILNHPVYNLYEECKLQVGVPVAPMLAKPSKEINEVLKRLSGLAFTMEYKYDGERAQVHLKEDGTVKIFSRNSEDNTEKYPDLREVIRRGKSEMVTSCIIDAEVVAYDREKSCLLPFQVLSTRKRKVESSEGEDSQKVKVILQVFDLLQLNGKSLLRESLRTRREILRKAFNHTEQYLHFASGFDHIEDGDTAPIETFLNEACNSACEGLMVKTLDENATYEPSKRSLNWLKLKKDYINGMGVCDSVDLVPIGGYKGRGKRVNVYGAYLMACYDPERDEYLSVCKLGTGFTDEDLLHLTNTMKEKIILSKKKPVHYNVADVLYPDDWFETGNMTWEVQAADLSRSSVHRGGLGRIANDLNDGSIRGIGLRFPRFLRERDDKKAEQATTSEQIVELFYNQSGSGKREDNEGGGGEDEDEWI